MEKKNIVTIDLNVWTTQATYARITGISLSTIGVQVKRVKEGIANRIEILEVPQLAITLVKLPKK